MNDQNINQTLPQEYKQYPIVTFCSNTLNNLKYLIEDKGFIPFLLGNGEVPRLWIYAKQDNNPIVLVRDSVAIFPGIKINIFNKEKRISIEHSQILSVENNKIFEMDFASQVPVVTFIDLRTLGYNLYGESNGLKIGNTSYQSKTFENITTLFKITTITEKF